MVIKIIFPGKLMVAVVSAFCYRNAHDKGKDDLFTLMDERMGVSRACVYTETYSHAGSGMPEILSMCK
jgi:hypothetical protein